MNAKPSPWHRCATCFKPVSQARAGQHQRGDGRIEYRHPDCFQRFLAAHPRISKPFWRRRRAG